MVEGTATLIVDLGNSETRVVTMYGKTSKGNPRSRMSILSNWYSQMYDDDLSIVSGNKAYTAENSKIFDVNGLLYCNGLLCDREFEVSRFRPTANAKKYSSISSKVALHNAFRQGFEDVAEIARCSVEMLNISWKVVVLLPPGDVDSVIEDMETGKKATGAEHMAEMVKGITRIDFSLPKVKCNVKLSSIDIYPEGFCALIAVLFEHKGVIRNDYRYLVNPDNRTLILDIGAGTTDVVMAKGSQIVSRSRFTMPVGGNNVHQKVGAILAKKNVVLPDSTLREACETGVIITGAKKYNVVKSVARAKDEVANQLISGVNGYFESNSIPILSINNLLICGGGSEEPVNSDIEPISTYIVNYFKQLTQNDIGLVELPVKKKLEGETIKTIKMSPRLLNITGASILAE